MNKFHPVSPDPFIVSDEDMKVAQFGHINEIVNVITDIQDAIDGPTPGVAPAGVTVIESGAGRYKTTELNFTDLVLGTLPGASASKAVGKLVYTFPAGAQVTDIVYMSVGLTGTGTANTPDVGIGSTLASGANALLSAAGATTEDYITGQTATNITGTATTVAAVPGATIGINMSSEVKTVYLNAAGAWAVGNTGNLTATGKIVIKWTKLS